MKKTSPCHAPVVGLDMWPVPLLLITSMSPSLVVPRAFPSHSLVPSGLRKMLIVLIAAPLIFPVVWPSSFISSRTPCGVISLIVLEIVLPWISNSSSPFDI